MPERMPVARSPIAIAPPEAVVGGWAVSARRSSANLVLVDCSAMTTVALRARDSGEVARALGVPMGRAARQRWGDGSVPVLVVGSGPDEWRALGPPGTLDLVVAHLTSVAADAAGDDLVSVVDLTHGTALVRLTGERSADLLAHETAVDLSDRAHPDGAALRTAVSGLAADVVRDDQGGVCSYLLGCERSSGQYLFDSLLDAGGPLGVDVDGFASDDEEPAHVR